MRKPLNQQRSTGSSGNFSPGLTTSGRRTPKASMSSKYSWCSGVMAEPTQVNGIQVHPSFTLRRDLSVLF